MLMSMKVKSRSKYPAAVCFTASPLTAPGLMTGCMTVCVCKCVCVCMWVAGQNLSTMVSGAEKEMPSSSLLHESFIAACWWMSVSV